MWIVGDTGIIGFSLVIVSLIQEYQLGGWCPISFLKGGTLDIEGFFLSVQGTVGEAWSWSCTINAAFWCIFWVIKLMRVSVWSNFSDGSVLGWVGDKDIVYINEYKLMLVGAV